jgi:thiamine kinase-like enzyme
MSRVKGKHVWDYENLSELEQRSLLADILYTLQDLHSRERSTALVGDVYEVYIEKTEQRVQSVSSLIPGFDKESVTVNGVKCPNIFHSKYTYLWDTIEKNIQAEYFTPIHGDPTFSNTLIDQNLKCWFIDPRGYFAHDNDINGDPDYDFAKVYYSAVGGYDTFNRRKFKLYADGETAEIIMQEPATANTAETLFQEFFPNKITKIRILHGLIWLALSGYAKDDIDSVIGSFYYGLYYLKQGLDKL